MQPPKRDKILSQLPSEAQVEAQRRRRVQRERKLLQTKKGGGSKKERHFVNQREHRDEKKRRCAVARWGGAELARSTRYEIYDGKVFFPAEDVNFTHMQSCGDGARLFWNPLGPAEVYDLVVVDAYTGKFRKNKKAARQFVRPKGVWESLRNFVVFWKGVKLSSERQPKPVDSVIPGGVSVESFVPSGNAAGASSNSTGALSEAEQDAYVRRRKVSFRSIIGADDSTGKDVSNE